VQRNPSARRSAVKGIASNAESGTGAGGEVAGTIAARFGQSRNNHEECVAQPVPYDLYQITAPINRQNRQPGDPCHTLARDNAAHAAIAIQGNLVGRDTGGPHGVGASEEGAMYTLTKADTHAVAFQQNQLGEVRCNNIAGTVNTNSNPSGRNTPMVAHAVAVSDSLVANNNQCTGIPTEVVAHAMTVRRLTPRECERLQGFPDDYTAIRWRGKAETPDGPRYKALGNSMAVNCMEWIGERIAAQEAR
jgi:DNA (cytosine-5)-methyltransferase 1